MDVPTYEAKNRLSALLDEVARGTEITITRRGVPVAKLVPVRRPVDREAARRAAEALLALGRTARLDGLRLKDLIGEGRP